MTLANLIGTGFSKKLTFRIKAELLIIIPDEQGKKKFTQKF